MGEPDSSHTNYLGCCPAEAPAKGLAGRKHGGDPGVAKVEMLFPGVLGAAAQAGRVQSWEEPRLGQRQDPARKRCLLPSSTGAQCLPTTC